MVTAWAVTAFSVLVGWIWLAPVLATATLVLMYCLRDPARDVPASPLGLVCPIDGKVVSIDVVTDPFRQVEARCIRLMVSATGPFVVRSPTEGRIEQAWVGHRSCACKGYELAATNARHIITDENDDVLLALYAPRWWRKPRCRALTGERIGQGGRCGFLYFRGCVELYVPLSAKLSVVVNDEVRAGSDLLGCLVHESYSMSSAHVQEG